MLSRLELLIDLLHSASDAALATHSSTLAGFPFASPVPFVTDPRHRPVILVSALAEHARNLAANSRASLMVFKRLGDGEVARVSLLGEVRRIDPDPLLVARYLRYHPHAERFLQLADFAFHRFEPVRVLTVGGFAQAGWLEGERIFEAPALPLADEVVVLEACRADLQPACRLVGVDFYGADVIRDGQMQRLRFEAGPVARESLPIMLREVLRRTGLAAG